MKRRIAALVPPWTDGLAHLQICLAALIGPSLISLWVYYTELIETLNIVCIWKDASQRVFLPGIMMHDFYTLLDGIWPLFWVPILTAVILAVVNRHGFHQGSKAVYLMRRLPDRWEYARRCLGLPLLTILLGMVLTVLVLLACWGLYTHFTPDYAIPPDQWKKFWAGIFHIVVPFLDWRY
ncbi:MAG: hypothetical protein IKB65_08310 [Ruminiclostridium sp.]|nr:hypothetical protein [Ruminiclostridium sp.]